MVNRAEAGARCTSTARQSASAPETENDARRDAAAREQPPTVLVVDVHQALPAAGRGEERGLGLEVVLLVGVEVEVVAAQVGEDRDVEDHAVDPPLHQRVAGDLHRARLDPALAHHREQPVQVGRLGRGERRLDVLAVDAGADGADDGGAHPRTLEGVLGQPGGGGLALGAGDAEQAQRAGRVVVHGATANRPSNVRGLATWSTGYPGRGPGRALRVGEQGHRAGRPSGRGVVDAVGAAPRQGGVDVTGQHPRRGQRDPGGRRGEVAVGRRGRVGRGQPRRPGRSADGGAGAADGSPERVARRVGHQGEATAQVRRAQRAAADRSAPPGRQVVGSCEGVVPVGGTP